MKAKPKYFFLLFYVLILWKTTNSLQIVPSSSTRLSLDLVGASVKNVDYRITFSVATLDIPAFSYIRIIFPMTNLMISSCGITTPSNTAGLYFNPSTDLGIDPSANVNISSTDPVVGIDTCAADVTSTNIINIRTTELIPMYTPIQVLLTVNTAPPTGIAYLSLSIQSDITSTAYVYANSLTFQVVPYISPIPQLTTTSVGMDYLDLYSYAFYDVINLQLLSIDNILNKTLVNLYQNINVGAKILQAKVYLSNSSPNIVKLAANSLYMTNFIPTNPGFMGVLAIQFTTSMIIPALSILDIQLPTDWTTNSSWTQCISVNNSAGAIAIPHSQCSVQNSYMYLYLLNAVPSNTKVQFNITFVKNPTTIITTNETVDIRIFEPYSGTIYGIGMNIQGLYTVAGSITVQVQPTQNYESLIMQGTLQYLTIIITSSNSDIPASSKISINMNPDSLKGPLMGTCIIYSGLKSLNNGLLNCNILSTGIIEITNFGIILQGTPVSIGFLNLNNAASQTVTVSIFTTNLLVPVFTGNQVITLQAPSGTATISTGSLSSCTNSLTLPFTQGLLCFQYSAIAGKAGVLTIKISNIISNDLSETFTCYTGSNLVDTTNDGECSLNQDLQFSTIKIYSNSSNNGIFAVSTIIFDPFFFGTDSFYHQLEFYFDFVDSNSVHYYALTPQFIDSNELTIDKANAAIVNAGTDPNIKLGIASISAYVNVPIIPGALSNVITLSTYFDPDIYDFSTYSNTAQYHSIDSTFTLNSNYMQAIGSKSSTPYNNYFNWPRIDTGYINSSNFYLIDIPFAIKAGAQMTNNSIIILVYCHDYYSNTAILLGRKSLILPTLPISLEDISIGSILWTDVSLGSASTLTFQFETETISTSARNLNQIFGMVLISVPWMIYPTKTGILTCYDGETTIDIGIGSLELVTGTQYIIGMPYPGALSPGILYSLSCDGLLSPLSTVIPAYSVYVTDTNGVALGYANVASTTTNSFTDAETVSYLFSVDYQVSQYNGDQNAFYPILLVPTLAIPATNKIKISFSSEFIAADQALNGQSCKIFVEQSK